MSRARLIALIALGVSLGGALFWPIGPFGAALAIVAIFVAPHGQRSTVALLAGGAILVAFVATGYGVWKTREYATRSATAEASGNLRALYEGLLTLDSTGAPLPHIPRTPSEIPCGVAHRWTADEHERWRALGFAPSETRYSYELRPPEGATGGATLLVLQARGDLDCDGQTSLFELSVGRTPDGDLMRSPGVYIEAELE